MRRHLLALGVGALCLTLPGLAFGQQSNTTAAVGQAGNANGTTQTASGGTTSQSATTLQLLPVAAATAVAPQVLPVNVHLPIRVASPGDGADVSQSNAASASADAASTNATSQTASGGSGKDGGSASQSATTIQVAPVAVAPSVAAQVLPVNLHVPVRVLSPGDDGAVDQSNAASAPASASNANGTTQVAGGWGKGKGGWGPGGSASQSATTGQLLPIGLAPALEPQLLPLNVPVPVRLIDELPPLPVDPFALLADPVGTVTGVLGDPVGTVTGLVGGLPLPALGGAPPSLAAAAPALPALPVDAGVLLGTVTGVLGNPVGTVTGALGNPVGAVTGLVGTVAGLAGGLPLPALPVDPAAVLADPVGTVTGVLGDRWAPSPAASAASRCRRCRSTRSRC